jgi:hypothetical protein
MKSIDTHSLNGAVLPVPAEGRWLDLGAGERAAAGYETMDISPVYSPDFQHDLTMFPWPFADETFVHVRAHHILEHIDRAYLIATMNEIHRILAPRGMADIEVPVFPFWTAIADPTHISFFVPQTFAYFCTIDSYTAAMRGAPAMDYAVHRRLYRIDQWEMRKAYRNDQGSALRVELVKP